MSIIPTSLPDDAALTPCSYAADVTSGDPREREFVFTSDGGLTVAVWEAQPYAENIAGYPADEFAYVVKGELTLTDLDGTARTFAAGDSYVMRKGWSGEFKVTAPFMKYFTVSAL